MVPLSSYKVPNDLFIALLKAPKLEEEMTMAMGSTHPLPVKCQP